ncbi:unnamed protein product, partial [marine sediment metagenome]
AAGGLYDCHRPGGGGVPPKGLGMNHTTPWVCSQDERGFFIETYRKGIFQFIMREANHE